MRGAGGRWAPWERCGGVGAVSAAPSHAGVPARKELKPEGDLRTYLLSRSWGAYRKTVALTAKGFALGSAAGPLPGRGNEGA